MAIDLILADIIQNELQINKDRISMYNQNFTAPSDPDIYIIISTGNTKILSSKTEYDGNTNEEVKGVVTYTQLNVDISSQSRDALLRKEEIIMALTSTYSVQQQELNTIKIWRNGDILDLSLVPGSSALHRYRIPVMISSVIIKRTAVEYFDKFKPVEVVEDV